MTISHLLLAAALTVSLSLQAAPLAAPEDLPSVIQRQAVAREALKHQADEADAALRQWYEAALDALRKDATARGDLDGVIATDAERRRMERALTAEENAALPREVFAVRAQLDTARAQRADQRKAALGASLREYLATLEALEKRFTQALQLDAAIAVRKERATAGAEMNGAPARVAEPAPRGPVLTVVSIGPPKPAAKPAPVLEVGSELRTWGKLASAAPEALSFECPNENSPGRGGRGVVLKNDPAAGQHGSTWTVDYTRSGKASNLQLVHPCRAGQVIVTVRKTGLDIDTPTTWSENGWDGSNHKRMRSNSGAGDVFPLEDGRKYQIVSQLGANGNYTIKIDGKVAGTSQVSAAPALTFPTVISDLPAIWAPGYAALLVGPVVNREAGDKNVCNNLTFQANAP